jgi:hypothetical protein
MNKNYFYRGAKVAGGPFSYFRTISGPEAFTHFAYFPVTEENVPADTPAAFPAPLGPI